MNVMESIDYSEHQSQDKNAHQRRVITLCSGAVILLLWLHTWSSLDHALPVTQTTNELPEQTLSTLMQRGCVLNLSLTVICSCGKKISGVIDSCTSQFSIVAMRVLNLVYLEASLKFPHL